jgi:hypothetical protein
LLMEYSAKEMSISPTFLVRKVPFEVPHDCGAALFVNGMYFWDPFLMKRRSPHEPVSSSTLIVFEFSRLFDLIDFLPELAFWELLKFLLKTFIMATTAVTLPVLAFSIDFSLALIISKAVLVALIG